MAKNKIQIDVKSEVVDFDLMECKLYFNDKSHRIYMSRASYRELISEGFFVRDGNSEDSAGAINTTSLYIEK